MHYLNDDSNTDQCYRQPGWLVPKNVAPQLCVTDFHRFCPYLTMSESIDKHPECQEKFVSFKTRHSNQNFIDQDMPALESLFPELFCTSPDQSMRGLNAWQHDWNK